MPCDETKQNAALVEACVERATLIMLISAARDRLAAWARVGRDWGISDPKGQQSCIYDYRLVAQLDALLTKLTPITTK